MGSASQVPGLVLGGQFRRRRRELGRRECRQPQSKDEQRTPGGRVGLSYLRLPGASSFFPPVSAPVPATNSAILPGPAVLFGLLDPHGSAQVLDRLVDEALPAARPPTAIVVHQAARDPAPLHQPVHQLLEMQAGAVERTEMRQEQRVGIPLPGSAPRSSRQSSRSMSGGGDAGITYCAAAPPDPGGVADERDPAGRLEEADVMGGMPGVYATSSVRRRDFDPLAALQHAQPRRPAPAGTHPTAAPCPARRAATRSPASFAGSTRCGAPRSWTNTSMCGFALHDRPVPRRRDRDGCASAGSGGRRRSSCPPAARAPAARFGRLVDGPGSISADPGRARAAPPSR